MLKYMDDLRWNDLQIFLAAQQAGTFSAAARALGVEQSTVSRRIASLEEALGAALFLRSRQGLVLTERGEQVLPLAVEVEQRVLEIAELGHLARVEGTVRVALTESMAVYGLPAALDELLAAHPALRLQLSSSMSASDLGRREADIAVRLFRTTRGDLVSKRVVLLPNGIWAHPRWRDRPWDELEWVGLDRDPGPSRSSAWIAAHAAREPRVTTNGFIAMVEAIGHGVGAGIVPDAIARRNPDLVRLLSPAPPPPPSSVYLVAHRASRQVPRIAAVWRFLESHLQAMGES